MHSIGDEGRDERLESALLLHLVMLHPAPLREDELVAELAVEPVGAEGRQRVQAAVTSLAEVGLLRRRGERVLPTPAAIRSYELWER
jgi:hypothetical protein